VKYREGEEENRETIQYDTIEIISSNPNPVGTMMNSDQFQIFLKSPYLQVPNRALTLNPDLTLRNLKLSLVPNQALDSFFFTFNGRPLADSATLRSSRVTSSSTLTLQFRLRGGGGDGGATGAESRDCYLNMYAVKKPDKVDPNEQRLSKWLNCAISNEPLKHPVVIDFLGNVFNKEKLVEALLMKKLPRAYSHIKGLKDMIAVELSVIPGFETRSSNLKAGLISQNRFECPITGLEFNGKYKFFGLTSCGHVLSAKALKEIKSSKCHVCHKEFTESDKIVINGSEEEVAALRKKMEEKLREKKKTKKIKNENLDLVKNGNLDLDDTKLSGTKHKIEEVKAAAERVKLKVEEGKGKAGGGIMVKSGDNGGSKRFKAIDHAPANATKEVYASIFTSSRKSDFKETYSCRSLPLGRN
jgi:hypothetical protein